MGARFRYCLLQVLSLHATLLLITSSSSGSILVHGAALNQGRVRELAQARAQRLGRKNDGDADDHNDDDDQKKDVDNGDGIEIDNGKDVVNSALAPQKVKNVYPAVGPRPSENGFSVGEGFAASGHPGHGYLPPGAVPIIGYSGHETRQLGTEDGYGYVVDNGASGKRKNETNLPYMILWAVIVIAVALMCILCTALYARRGRRQEAEDRFDSEDISKSKARNSKSHSPPRSQTNVRSKQNRAARGSGHSQGSELESDNTSLCHSGVDGKEWERRSMTSMDTGSDASRSQGVLPGHPLCPVLIVPADTRLACIVQDAALPRRQDLAFSVTGMPSHGGAPLFQVRISELGETQRIYVETLDGKDQFAFMDTADLWNGSPDPKVSIYRPWGIPYGVLERTSDRRYAVVRGDSAMLTFSGDFQHHNIQVTSNVGGQAVACVSPLSAHEYRVDVQACTDAGLVMLGLMAIDKFENGVGSVRSLGSQSNSNSRA